MLGGILFGSESSKVRLSKSNQSERGKGSEEIDLRQRASERRAASRCACRASRRSRLEY